jgi:hypothetical protein
MSTLAYAAMTRTRTAAQPGSTIRRAGAAPAGAPPGSPGVTTYVDAFAALVPAEVLVAHASFLTFTTQTANEVVTITKPQALTIAFYALIVVSAGLYIAGRLKAAKWDNWDYARMLIPPLAFVGWTMLQKATAFDAVAGNSLDDATRNVIAIIGGIALGVAAAALAYKADQKPVP